MSAPVDPRTDAVRPDLADVRLADRIFAPHYAAALPRRLCGDTPLLAAPSADTETLEQLAAGDRFELLDEARGFGWGVSAAGTVGYCDAAMLAPPEGDPA